MRERASERKRKRERERESERWGGCELRGCESTDNDDDDDDDECVNYVNLA